MKKARGVFIGRFQPLHNAHLKTIQYALSIVDRLTIVVGSADTARNVYNPFTVVERFRMINSCLTSDESERVDLVKVSDFLYNNNLWVAHVQEAIRESVGSNVSDDNVLLFGHNKDASSYYLKLFPNWEFVETNSWDSVDATSIRDLYFQQDFIGLKNLIPDGSYSFLRMFHNSSMYHDLKKEYDYLKEYHRMWEGAPFPVTFVTADAVVMCSGHILLVRRKIHPGKGLLALPGGFLGQNETVECGAVRELKEETGIKLTSRELESMIVDQRVFDHPKRSLRGRTITHAFCFNVNQKQSKLPIVKGADDAAEALWMPLSEVFKHSDEFFDDHVHIIRHFAFKM